MNIVDTSENDYAREGSGSPGTVRLPPHHADRVDMEMSLALFLRILRRRKWVLILSVLLVTALTIVAVNQLTPKYTATVDIIIDPKQINVVNLDSIIAQVPPNDEVIASQIEIIRSRDLARKVIDRLELHKNPEFNPILQPPAMMDDAVAFVKDRIRETLALLGIGEIVGETGEGLQWEEHERSIVTNVFRGALAVQLRGNSRVIAVSFTSADPELAAQVANTVVDMYLNEQLEAKFNAAKRAQVWLNERLTVLRQQVEESESAVEEYRAAAGLVDGVNSSVITEQISALSAQLIEARAAETAAEARLAQVQTIATVPTNLQYVPEALNFPVLQQLWQEQASLLRQEAELAGKFGSQHPQLVNLRSQLVELRERIQSEINRVVRSLRNEVGAARTRSTSLERQLKDLQTSATQYDIAQAKLRALRREAETNQKMLQTFLERSKQSGDLVQLEEPDARVLSRASLPLVPSYPDKKLALAGALACSVMLGLFLMYVLEKLDRTFRSGEEVESMLGLPCLALVPTVTSIGSRRALHEYVIKKPVSVFAESVRLLRTALWLQGKASKSSERPKCVSITSSKPGESKTSVAIALARAAAHAGERVILIDCDVRQPAMAQAFKAPAGCHGLLDLLSGSATRNEVVQTDYASPLDFITAGSTAANSAKLLMSNAMVELIAELRQDYDLVVLDSPPALAISDARIIARIADAVIYCVRWRETSRSSVMNGLRALTDSGAHVLGVALTQVNMKAHARSGFSDAENYSRQYSGYFAN